jgi:hypothetical protein
MHRHTRLTDIAIFVGKKWLNIGDFSASLIWLLQFLQLAVYLLSPHSVSGTLLSIIFILFKIFHLFFFGGVVSLSCPGWSSTPGPKWSWHLRIPEYLGLQESTTTSFFGRTGVWTQGFMFANQALYCLSLNFSPFCSSYFGDGVSRTLCLGWPQTAIIPISAYQVAGITDLSHQSLAQKFLV